MDTQEEVVIINNQEKLVDTNEEIIHSGMDLEDEEIDATKVIDNDGTNEGHDVIEINVDEEDTHNESEST